jgi:hypothetical protein
MLMRRPTDAAGIKATMVEYGLIASKSSEVLMGIMGNVQGLWEAIPFGPPVAVGAGIAAAVYLIFRKR